MPELSPQVVADLTETIDHLNANHADSVLFVAQHLLDEPAIVDAEITGIDHLGAVIATTSGGADRSQHLDWAGPIESRADAQRAMFAALDEARRRAGALPPLTSLEVERATTPTIPTFATTVTAISDISPNLRQIDLAGGLDDFNSVGGDQFVYLMAPHAPDQPIPARWSMADQRNAGPDSPLCGAYYTVRSWDPTNNQLTLWMVRHGHPTGVGAWADRCSPGDPVAIWGPRHGFGTGHHASNHLFVTDESGFAAAAVLLEALPPDSRTTVFAETVDEDHQIELPADDVTWLYRDEDPERGDLLLEAVRAAAIDTADLIAWGAGESRLMTAIRKHLREERGMRSTTSHMTGYWRRTR